MLDEDVFTEATRLEDWVHLAGTGPAARARSVGLRRTRHLGIAGTTAAAAVGAAVIVGTFGIGVGRSSATPAAAGPAAAKSAPSTSQGAAMSTYFERWKSCPDSELTVASTAPPDLIAQQQALRDACHRYTSALSALLPGYEIVPDVANVGYAPGRAHNPQDFENPAFVVPPGDVPHMSPNDFRVVGKDGATTWVHVRASNRDEDMKPISGEQVALHNGLKATLTLGTGVRTKDDKGYEIYILWEGKTFSMSAASSGPKPGFDFKALVMSPQFADMVAQALAEPES